MKQPSLFGCCPYRLWGCADVIYVVCCSGWHSINIIFDCSPFKRTHSCHWICPVLIDIQYNWSKVASMQFSLLWMSNVILITFERFDLWPCPLLVAGPSGGLAGLPELCAVAAGVERHRAGGGVRQGVPAAGVRPHQQDGPQVRGGQRRAEPCDWQTGNWWRQTHIRRANGNYPLLRFHPAAASQPADDIV